LVFAATGAVTAAAGATFFFSLFDVVITSFLSQFSFIVVFATHSYSSGTGIYALCLNRKLNDFKEVFAGSGQETRRGIYEGGPDNTGVIPAVSTAHTAELPPPRSYPSTGIFTIIATSGNPMNNIILIGMPGAGKSTVGVILATTRGMKFIDTDIAIQETTGRLLQEIIDTDGPDAFRTIEEETVLSLHGRHAVIATGGSVVFSERAMEHLTNNGIVVYLKISFAEMEQRLRNSTTRGIVLLAGQGLFAMYIRRIPLYEKYADITIDCEKDDFEKSVQKIIAVL
jgi:shikimate kinase